MPIRDNVTFLFGQINNQSILCTQFSEYTQEWIRGCIFYQAQSLWHHSTPRRVHVHFLKPLLVKATKVRKLRAEKKLIHFSCFRQNWLVQNLSFLLLLADSAFRCAFCKRFVMHERLYNLFFMFLFVQTFCHGREVMENWKIYFHKFYW